MNVLPCERRGGRVASWASRRDQRRGPRLRRANGKLELGVRPEFVRFADRGIPVDVVKVADAGRFRIVETSHGEHRIKLLVPEGQPMPIGVRACPVRSGAHAGLCATAGW